MSLQPGTRLGPYDVTGTLGAGPAIVMELVEGPTLADLIESGGETPAGGRSRAGAPPATGRPRGLRTTA